MAISCLKLITGEDLIADVSETLGGDVKISSPCMVLMLPTGNNNYTVGLAPFLPYAEHKEFVYKKEHIVIIYDASAPLKNQYNQMTGKGLVVPESKIELLK